MRRILASLFVISAVISLGVFATGAYFTDTITQDNYQFTTESADLKFAFCGPEGTNCAGTTATLDNITFGTAQVTGPGKTASDCLVIENTGDYALALSSQLSVTGQSHHEMDNYFEVRTEQATAGCTPAGPVYQDWASAEAVSGLGMVASGVTLNPGDRLYIITRNRWNSSGDQNHLQGGSLTLRSVIEGRTQ